MIVVWAAIAAYVFFAGRYAAARRSEVTVGEVKIIVRDTTGRGVVAPATVSRWLAAGNVNPVGTPVDEVDTRAIERILTSHSEVSEARVWTDLNGLLNVDVSQRRPIMRVIGANGYRFWVTDDNHILRDRGAFTAHVPVVTGVMPFPFGVTAEGSYDEMIRRNYDDFLVQFAALESEARTLSARRDSVQARIRSTRAMRSKRFWAQSRKDQLAEYKTKHLAELRQEVRHADETMAALALKKKALREKEKKSYQSYNFLSKLVNFVKLVENDDFWSAQIVQINVLGRGAGEAAGNGNIIWREPDIELIPRAGDHIILLGELDGEEKERLDKLKTFYHNAAWHEGWKAYRRINIKYRGQIVCSE